MANIELITKAKLYGKALNIITGQAPDYDIQPNKIRVYYQPDHLRAAQKQFEKMVKSKSDISVEWLPIITPYLIKTYAPYLLLGLTAAYVIGKIK